MTTRLEALRAELRKRMAVAEGPPDPVTFARTLGVTPDPWQERVLCWQGKRLLLNCSRQAGKSTTTAILALHRAMYTPRSLVLLISPSLRQSVELFRKVTDLVAGMPARPDLIEDNKTALTLGNGSRIISLPSSEDTIRGFSAVSLIVEDEAGFVDDALNTAVRPMLAVSGGQLVLMSTPKGRRGHFFDAWEKGGDNWDRIKITGWQVPRIDPNFLREEKRVMGEMFRQEYEGEFINAATGRVYGMFDRERNGIQAAPKGGEWTYLLGLDFGVVDQNAMTVLGWRKHDPCVYVLESYRKTCLVDGVADEVKALDAKYGLQHIVGDTGGMGKLHAAELAKRHHIYVATAEKQNKLGAINLINGDLATGRVRVVMPNCADLVEEWESLPWAEKGEKEADGFPNHCADSCLYSWRAACAYLEEPAEVRPQPGTPEAHIAEEAEAVERRIAELSGETEKDWRTEW